MQHDMFSVFPGMSTLTGSTMSVRGVVCHTTPRTLMVLPRGVADGGVGGPDPRTFENRAVRPPPQIRE